MPMLRQGKWRSGRLGGSTRQARKPRGKGVEGRVKRGSVSGGGGAQRRPSWLPTPAYDISMMNSGWKTPETT